jgi:thymidylate synthase
MNNIDKQYQALLQDIIDNGVEKKDRTGTGTISVFGRQIRHNMKDGFPLLTTKKMAWKTMVTELLWFLRGDTNIKYLVDNDCHIWDGDAYKNYLKNHKDNLIGCTIVLSNGISAEITAQHNVNRNVLITTKGRINIEGDDTITILNDTLTQEEFINKIKTDDEFANKWGELGPIYGKQWRSWEPSETYSYGCIDQIANLIHNLKTNPDSRRLMVSAWNVGELDQMVLPPCHNLFQMYSVEKKGKRYLSIMVNIRSNDVPLGLPFNIASYALLLEIVARLVNMTPDELIVNIGDAHIYLNQIEGIKEQLIREPYELPKLNINTEFWPTESGECGVGPIDALAVLRSFSNDNFCKCLLEEDIQLVDYQSHPSIKLPLSN